VREILHQTAEPFPGQQPSLPGLNAKWHEQLGYGMLDARAAVGLALRWPGMTLGADTDSDGVRDYLDAAPYNTTDATMPDHVPTDLMPAGGEADSDGDGVADADDAAPLDPMRWEAEGAGEAEDTPVVVVPLVIALVAAAAARRR
jgi:hypothetical protein